MSNYTVTTNFGDKDSLPSGNPSKIIKGSEFSTEFNNIATASATKADLASPTFTGTVTIPTANIAAGAINATSLDLQNNEKIQLGDADQLEIYTDGTNSIIRETGSGALSLRGNEISIKNPAGTETMAFFTQNGAASLYFDDAVKFATTATGNLSNGNIAFGDNHEIIMGVGNDLKIYHDGTDSYIEEAGTGNLKVSSSLVEITGGLTTTDSVGVGVVNPARPLHVYSALTDVLGRFESGDATAGIEFIDATTTAQIKTDNGTLIIGADTNNEVVDSVVSFRVDTTEKLRIEDDLIIIKDNSRVNDDLLMSFGNSLDMSFSHVSSTNTNTIQNNNVRPMVFNGVSFVFQNQGATEKLMELTANGAVDLYHNNTKRFETTDTGVQVTGATNTNSLIVDRDTTGIITQFKANGALAGAVRTTTSSGISDITLGSGDVGVRFVNAAGGSLANISPTSVTTNGAQDDLIDLGRASARWDNIYATNGTINTSDANDKQSIEELTEAETRVAVACKGLVRKFKWNSAVEQKGSEARYHFGVIAQDVQSAFEAEGLDAGDYGVFVSSTWEDENGVEQTRLGVRYTELLAFIIGGL